MRNIIYQQKLISKTAHQYQLYGERRKLNTSTYQPINWQISLVQPSFRLVEITNEYSNFTLTSLRALIYNWKCCLSWRFHNSDAANCDSEWNFELGLKLVIMSAVLRSRNVLSPRVAPSTSHIYLLFTVFDVSRLWN